MTEIEKAKTKIKKLLALSKSSNENEALSALEKANELMKEFNLTQQEIDLSAIKKEYTKSTIRNSPWRNQIFHAVADMYCCDVAGSHGEATVCFFGCEMDSFMAKELSEYLIKSILRIAKNSIRKNAKSKFRERFKLGLACGIAERIRAMNSKLWMSENFDQKKELVKKYMETLDLTVSKSKRVKIGLNDVAFTKGYVKKDDISFSNQMNNSQKFYLNT